MKRRIFLVILALILVVSASSVFAVAADGTEASTPAAQASEPSLKFYGATLVLSNTIEIRYIANLKNVEDVNDVKLLVWINAPEEYKKGTERYEVSYAGKTQSVSGVSYPCFDFKNAGAKRMTDNFYAVLYMQTADGVEHYSSPVKYSILNYAYSKLGKTGTMASDPKLITLINSILDYGACSQEYLNYHIE